MVDLPPSIDELNEYGKFAYLNEMHTMASKMAQCFTDNATLSKLLKLAIDCIEDERGSMRELFDGTYQRPQSKKAVALVLRCSELYLDLGFWFQLTHADLRLKEKGESDEVIELVKTCFHETNLTDRYLIQSPIIELTLTRLEMMTFFETRQKEIYKGISIMPDDPLSNFVVKTPDPLDEAELMNASKMPDDPILPTSFLVSDEEYLVTREEYAWAAYSSFRPLGSLFCLLWYIIFSAVSIQAVTVEYKPFPAVSVFCSGFGLAMLCAEIASLRVCLIACFRPKSTIAFIYPGIDFYYIQYFATCIAAVAIVLTFFIQRTSVSMGVNVMAVQMLISVIVPFCFIPCFWNKLKRVERKFTWARAGFFTSKWWMVVKIVFCIIFTPGIHGQRLETNLVQRSEQSRLKLRMFEEFM